LRIERFLTACYSFSIQLIFGFAQKKHCMLYNFIAALTLYVHKISWLKSSVVNLLKGHCHTKIVSKKPI
jgi:hypothetical protein